MLPLVARLAKRRSQLLLAGVRSLAGWLVRLPFLTVDYNPTADMGLYRQWARLIQANGLASAYDGTAIDYPPASLYLFGAAGWLEATFGRDLSPAGKDALLNSVTRLASFSADVLTAALIAWALGAVPARLQAAACAAYLFNPAIWYVSAYWGQIDSICALLVAASVVAMMQPRPAFTWLACALGALAVATKLQCLALAPPLALAVYWRAGWPGLAKGLVAGGAILALLAGPWIAGGTFWQLAAAVIPHAAPRVSVSAYNLWYLVFRGDVHTASSLLRPFGPPFTFQQIGLGLAGANTAAVLLGLWRRSARRLALGTALVALGMFGYLTQMHERYLMNGIVLLALAAAVAHGGPQAHRLWWAYGLLSATFLYNLFTVAPFTRAFGGNLIALPPEAGDAGLLRALALIVSAVNVAALIAFTGAFLRPGRRRRATAPRVSWIANES